jgi:MlaD protein
MRSFNEPNPMIIGTVGIVAVAGVVLAALNYQKLPFLNQGHVSAYFADAGGLRTGDGVEVSGYPVGKVCGVELDGPGVRVKFKVGKNIRPGNRTEALGESVSSGPFFKAYVVNLLPGQFVQPFIGAAFSDLGLDPATLAPSQTTEPPTGQPGTPPLPVPDPRTGQGGGPRLNLPDAITGNPGDHPCGLPGLPLPGPGCYPYRQPPPAPPPGGPPPGPPAPPPPGLESRPEPTPSRVYVQAPGEVRPAQQPGGQP